MQIGIFIVIAAVVVAFAYLVYVLIYPERF